MWTIYKREMGAYFRSAVAYCIMGFFMVLVGINFWRYNITGGSVYFSSTLDEVSYYLIFITPLLTMKLLADERRNGTEVLLRTSPISIWKIVVGKYLAAASLFTGLMVLTLIYPIIMSFLATDGMPVGRNFGSYVAFFMLGLSYLAIGLLTSSFSENQVVAAVSGVVILHVLYFLRAIGATLGGTFGSILQWISPLTRYSDFSIGEFSFASMIYYITFAAVAVFLTVMNMERKRWN